MTSLQTTIEPATPAGATLGSTPGPAAAVASLRRADAGRSAVRRMAAAAWRDPLAMLSLAMAAAVVTIATLLGPERPVMAYALVLGFLAVEYLLGRAERRARPGIGWWLTAARYGTGLWFVVAAGLVVDPAGNWPLNSLMIPVVALAAAESGSALWATVAAIAFAIVPGILLGEHSVELQRRLVAWGFAASVTAFGSRQVVTSLRRSRDRLRGAHTLQRRRARQLAAVEAVGAILAELGPTPKALDSVVGLLVGTFGYRYPSIYTWDGQALRLGAQRNYDAPIESFPTDRGVIGRVARTREAAFIPDIALDPDYVSADNGVVSEISLPLVAHDELLGVLNVEMAGPRRLDLEDFATLKIVADRLSVSLALGRERLNLTERARLMDSLVAFSRSLGGTLDPATVHQQVVAGICRVIAADMAVVVLRDPTNGEFRVAQVEGGDPTLLGARILPGEGATGRAIEQGIVVVEERQERNAWPSSMVNARLADTVAAMSAPLRHEAGVIGALSWVREDVGWPFTDQEREVAALLAAQVALAIANAELHHATEIAAVTDALTGLHNRRHFDVSIERAEAARARDPEGERRDRSAIVFDLDHFGQVNKLHGHQVGDRILQAFADVLRRRVRASDLAARYGGEEFVVVLDGATRNEAVRLADEIREAFGGIRFGLPDGSALGCTVSAGCSALAPSETASQLLIERADVGLAMAKASGRDRVVAV